MSFSDFIMDNYETMKSGRRNELRICCPLCDDSKFHGYVNVSKGIFHCFKCNSGQTSISRGFTAYHFLRQIHGLSNNEAQAVLKGDGQLIDRREKVDITKLLNREKDEEEEFQEFREIQLPPTKPIQPDDGTLMMGAAASTYMSIRLGREYVRICKELKIEYCISGQYSGRIVLPVYLDNKPVFFTARSFFPADALPTYMNPFGVNPPLFAPYGFDKEAILCEGYFDAISIGRGGIAVFGSALTNLQFEQFLDWEFEKVIVCFDDDRAGHDGAVKLCRKLKHHVPDIRTVLDLDGRDPDELGDNAARFIRKRSMHFENELEILFKRAERLARYF
jgi:DNA primase